MMVRVSLPPLVFALALALSGLVEARTLSRPDPTIVDSARSEFDAGRTWHAARLLAPLEARGLLTPSDLLLLARARAGYRDWEGVVEVLASAPWIDRVEAGSGWLLIGRAREALAEPGASADAYSRYLALTDAGDPRAPSVAARLARMQWAAGDTEGALATLDTMERSPVLRSWAAWSLARRAIDAGSAPSVDVLVGRITDEAVLARAWGARERALATAGDSAAAAAGYATLLARTGPTPGDRLPEARLVIADQAFREGRPSEAIDGWREVAANAPGGSEHGARAAAALIDHDAALDAGATLVVARRLDRAGDGKRALVAYDLYVERAGRQGIEPAASARVERARLMSTVSSRQADAIREWRALSVDAAPEVGARTLTLWAQLRRRQGRTADYETLRRWLVERYPGTSEAAGIIFFQADAAHDREQWQEALAGYDQVARMAPALDYAGLARMRVGQIHLSRGEVAEALETFERYLEDFPQGRRWEEASYWAARTHLEAGDTAAGLALLDRLRAEVPFSYYSVLTADLLGEPYRVDLPTAPPAAPPAWLDTALRDVDQLTSAGLTEGADAVVARYGERAKAEGAEALMALAEGLDTRGRTLTGINLGWAARQEGAPWSDRLVRIVYPFPYQELVLREAREVGVDPLLLAALIRQESAFVPDIVSGAGAVGLMQVMPATGRKLARSLGVDNFTAETLESPEVNLHLGARFLVDQLDRYGPDLPLVLSAYNAGPARADRWRGFPEADDLLRLTERIPFSETRGYVKNVTRNRRLYEALYGGVVSATGR